MPLKLVDDHFVPPSPNIDHPSLSGAAVHGRMAVEHMAMAYAHVGFESDDNEELRRAMVAASAQLGWVMARIAARTLANTRAASGRNDPGSDRFQASAAETNSDHWRWQ